MTDGADNSITDSVKVSRVPPQLTPFKPGTPKPPNSGKKKGYKSITTVLREMLQKMTEKDETGQPISLQEAALMKQIRLAIDSGDRSALTWIFKQAKDYVADETPKVDPTNNFLNIESFKQIINNKDFLDTDDDIIEIEAEDVTSSPTQPDELTDASNAGADAPTN